MMGALDVPGLWRINKSFRAGVQVIQLGFFYSLPGVQAVHVQVVYCMLVMAQRGSVAQHDTGGVEIGGTVTAGTAHCRLVLRFTI
jgi:hypothetical protein